MPSEVEIERSSVPLGSPLKLKNEPASTRKVLNGALSDRMESWKNRKSSFRWDERFKALDQEAKRLDTTPFKSHAILTPPSSQGRNEGLAHAGTSERAAPLLPSHLTPPEDDEEIDKDGNDRNQNTREGEKVRAENCLLSPLQVSDCVSL